METYTHFIRCMIRIVFSQKQTHTHTDFRHSPKFILQNQNANVYSVPSYLSSLFKFRTYWILNECNRSLFKCSLPIKWNCPWIHVLDERCISIFVPSHFFSFFFFHISYHLVINISIISFWKDLVDYCIKAQNVMRSA